MTNEQPWWETIRYDFIKVPKDLFRASHYQSLSPEAKLLYAFLLDRTSLSYVNGDYWRNQDGSVFVYFTIEEITKRFGCGKEKASALLSRLAEQGLITRTRESRNSPYRIVVKPFLAGTESRQSREGKTKPREVGKTAPNKTEFNQTEHNQTEINHTDTTKLSRGDVVWEIKERISYDLLLAEHNSREWLDGIVNIMADVECSYSPQVRLMKMTVPGDEMREKLRRLDDMDIRYVIDRLREETGHIRDTRMYILTLLYEARDVMDIHFSIQANHDGAAVTP